MDLLIEEILNEKYSVSEIVINKTKEIMELLLFQFINKKWEMPTRDSLNFPYKRWRLENYKYDKNFGCVGNIEVMIINVVNIDNYDILHDKFGGELKSLFNRIDIVLPFYDGSLNINFTSQTLAHELEHAYQLSKTDFTDYRDLYKNVDILQDKYIYDDEIYDYLHYIYYLNKKEIDANTHSLWCELDNVKPKSKEEYDNLLPLRILRKIISDKELLFSGKKERVLNILLNELNVSREWLNKYFEEQIGYAERKFRKVIGVYLGGYRINENVITKLDGRPRPKWMIIY